MIWINKLLVFFLIFFFSLSCKNNNKQMDELVIGMDLTFPPFEGIDSNGNAYGISVDLGHDLANFLGKKAKISNTKWEGLIPSLKTKKCDIILSSMSITPERSEMVDFSQTYGELGIELVTRSDFFFDDNIENLNNPKIRVNVRKGTVSDVVGTKFFKRARLVRLLDFDSSILELIQNKADVVLMDPISAFRYQQRHKNELKVHYLSLGIAQMAIAVPKSEDKTFLNQINEFLTEYKSSGKMEVLVEKYLGDLRREFQKQNRPFTIIF